MFDMSWGEVMLIGAVALIVIGPKELPKALRTLGNVTSKVRKLAGEFQTQFNDAMREADLEDAKRQVEGLSQSVSALNTSFNPVQTIRDEIKGAIESRPASGGSGAGPAPATPATLPEAVPSIDLPPPIQAPDPASPMPRDDEPASLPADEPREASSPAAKEGVGHPAA